MHSDNAISSRRPVLAVCPLMTIVFADLVVFTLGLKQPILERHWSREIMVDTTLVSEQDRGDNTSVTKQSQ